MRIKYNLEKEDYINFNLYRIQYDDSAIEMIKKQKVLGSLAFILLGAAMVFFANRGQVIVALVMIAISAFWYFNFPNLARKRVVKATTKALNNPNVSDFFKDLDVSITYDNISESDQVFSWDQIKNSVETNDYLYVFFEDNTTLIIPKRVVMDSFDELKTIVFSSAKQFESINF